MTQLFYFHVIWEVIGNDIDNITTNKKINNYSFHRHKDVWFSDELIPFNAEELPSLAESNYRRNISSEVIPCNADDVITPSEPESNQDDDFDYFTHYREKKANANENKTNSPMDP